MLAGAEAGCGGCALAPSARQMWLPRRPPTRTSGRPRSCGCAAWSERLPGRPRPLWRAASPRPRWPVGTLHPLSGPCGSPVPSRRGLELTIGGEIAGDTGKTQTRPSSPSPAFLSPRGPPETSRGLDEAGRCPGPPGPCHRVGRRAWASVLLKAPRGPVSCTVAGGQGLLRRGLECTGSFHHLKSLRKTGRLTVDCGPPPLMAEGRRGPPGTEAAGSGSAGSAEPSALPLATALWGGGPKGTSAQGWALWVRLTGYQHRVRRPLWGALGAQGSRRQKGDKPAFGVSACALPSYVSPKTLRIRTLAVGRPRSCTSE